MKNRRGQVQVSLEYANEGDTLRKAFKAVGFVSQHSVTDWERGLTMHYGYAEGFPIAAEGAIAPMYRIDSTTNEAGRTTFDVKVVT